MNTIKFFVKENIPLVFLLSLLSILGALSFMANEIMYGFSLVGIVLAVIFYSYSRGDFNIESLTQRKDILKNITLSEVEKLISEEKIKNIFVGRILEAQIDFADAVEELQQQTRLISAGISVAGGLPGVAAGTILSPIIQAGKEVLIVRLNDDSYKYVEIANGLTRRVQHTLAIAGEYNIRVENLLSPDEVGHPIFLALVIIMPIVILGVIVHYFLPG